MLALRAIEQRGLEGTVLVARRGPARRLPRTRAGHEQARSQFWFTSKWRHNCLAYPFLCVLFLKPCLALSGSEILSWTVRRQPTRALERVEPRHRHPRQAQGRRARHGSRAIVPAHAAQRQGRCALPGPGRAQKRSTHGSCVILRVRLSDPCRHCLSDSTTGRSPIRRQTGSELRRRVCAHCAFGRLDLGHRDEATQIIGHKVQRLFPTIRTTAFFTPLN